MGKRYFFWRQPDGRPYGGVDERHSLTAALRVLGETAVTNTSGAITFNFPGPYKESLILKGAAVIQDPETKENLNADDAWGIVQSAYHQECREHPKQPVDAKRLAQRADALAAEFFRRTIDKYLLLTTLGVAQLPQDVVSQGASEIMAASRLGVECKRPASLSDATDDLRFTNHLQSTKYLSIAVRCQGRSVHDAAENALRDVNVARGLWMLRDSYGRWTHEYGIRAHHPIGQILLGPIHTIHHLDGTSASDLWWYQPEYQQDGRVFQPDAKNWEELEESRKLAVGKLASLANRRELERLLGRYAMALSEVDPSVAFLKLWSLLERITDTVGAKYDETVKRVASIYKDRSLAKEYLSHLQLRRNQYVHAAESHDEMNHTIQLAKSFCDEHLIWLIENVFQVDSLADYGECLKLPTSVEPLERMRRRVERAIKVRSPPADGPASNGLID